MTLGHHYTNHPYKSKMKSASLLDLLALLAPESTKTTLRSWIKLGRVTVDKEVITQASFLVEEGREVQLLPKPRFTDKGGIKILYQDRFLVVVDKPEGVLSVKAPFEHEKTLHKYLKATFGPNVKVVHRLDQGTSGVILFAFEEKTYKALKKLFEKHDVKRRYLAVLEGSLQEEKGTWESYLYEDEAYVVHSSPRPVEKSRLATTHYTVINKSKHYTLVECSLDTGRKNQIRVHASDCGHPVTGDSKYGAQKDPLSRLALHAYSLEFLHPMLKKKMRFESPVPESFLKFFKNG